MDRQILENDKLRIEIDKHGAELSRIFDKIGNCERLHDADPAIWNRHSPVLFPMVGASYEGKYRLNGKTFTIGQHGFARDCDFTLVESGKDHVSYVLTESEETLKKYPFPFKLTISHELVQNKIIVSWKVENTGKDTMLFNIGGHPAFLLGDHPKTDVSFQFPGKEKLIYIGIDQGGTGCAITDKKYELPLENESVKVTDNFFDIGTYIFQEGQIDTVTMSIKDKPAVSVHCKGFPYFGIWTKPGSSFICLEPWCGRCDKNGFDGDLSEKEGIMSLEPGEVFDISYDIEIFPLIG